MTPTGKAIRLALGVAVIAALIMVPMNFNRYGLFILSQWAVMTIAAMGLNLTLGYAGQVSLAQGAFVGIGAYASAIMTTQGMPLIAALGVAVILCFAIGWILGYPALRVQHHYLAFVTLAFSTRGLSGIPQRGLADQGHLRHQQHSAPSHFRLRHQQARAVLLSLPWFAWHRLGDGVVADPLALGTRLHGLARESVAGAVARHRY
jgi:branched-subunit amino acid ABC-type transport system permease component